MSGSEIAALSIEALAEVTPELVVGSTLAAGLLLDGGVAILAVAVVGLPVAGYPTYRGTRQ